MTDSTKVPRAAGIPDVDTLIRLFEEQGYVTDRALATAIFLGIRLGKPVLIEGHAGLGKTEVAKVLAAVLNTRLIRLQCYEGLDVNSAVYEWNYQKQLLAIKLEEGTGDSIEDKEKHIFSREFLLERPLHLAVAADFDRLILLGGREFLQVLHPRDRGLAGASQQRRQLTCLVRNDSRLECVDIGRRPVLLARNRGRGRGRHDGLRPRHDALGGEPR